METLLRLPQVRISELERKISKGHATFKEDGSIKNGRNLSCSGLDVQAPYYYHTHQKSINGKCNEPKCLCCWLKPKSYNHPTFAFLFKKNSQHGMHAKTEPCELGPY